MCSPLIVTMSEFENSSGEEDWLPPTQPGRAFSVSVEESCSRREVDEGTDGGDEFSEDDLELQIEGKSNNDYLECEDEEVATLTAADTVPSVEEGKGKSLLSHVYKPQTMHLSHVYSKTEESISGIFLEPPPILQPPTTHLDFGQILTPSNIKTEHLPEVLGLESQSTKPKMKSVAKAAPLLEEKVKDGDAFVVRNDTDRQKMKGFRTVMGSADWNDDLYKKFIVNTPIQGIVRWRLSFLRRPSWQLNLWRSNGKLC